MHNIILFSQKKDTCVPYLYRYVLQTDYGANSLNSDLSKFTKVIYKEDLGKDAMHFLLVNHFDTLDSQQLARDGCLVIADLTLAISPAAAYVFVLAAIAPEHAWEITIEQRNSASWLIEKANRLKSTEGSYPNFFAVDYVGYGDPLGTPSYCSAKFISAHLNKCGGSNIIIPLGIWGIIGTEAPAYLADIHEAILRSVRITDNEMCIQTDSYPFVFDLVSIHLPDDIVDGEYKILADSRVYANFKLGSGGIVALEYIV